MASSTSDQECSLDEFIKERLKSCQVTPKGMITGYIESKKAYDELFRDLKVLGCRYSVRSCYAGKTDTGNLQYKTMSPDLQIPFTGSPFHVEGTTYFLCIHGVRYYKSKVPEQEIDDGNGNNGTRKKRRKINESIKLGCPAKMTVKCIRVYPDYKTSADSWRRKSDVLKRLKADLKLTPSPRHELNYWIAVSPESAHIHERTTTQRIQPLHPDLTLEIHRLVRKGMTSVPVIKSQLSVYVENMFRKSSIHPDHCNTAFYPSDKSIYNHVHDAKMALSKEQSEEIAESQQDVDTSPTTTIPSEVSQPPHQNHQVTEKCAAELAAVPVIDTSFPHDWQDQAVLPSNFVQVVNNSVTLMLMVAQPLGNQVGDQVGNSVIDSPTNLVNIDENLYTVITDPSDERILHLSNNPSILMPQSCSDHNEMGEVLTTIQDSNQTVAVNSDKDDVVDMDRVITMEGNVIMGVRSNSNLLDDKDDTSCNEDQSQFLFVGDDSQNELLKEVSSGAKEFSALCTLPPAHPHHEDHIFSSDDKGDALDKNSDSPFQLDENKDSTFLSKSKNVGINNCSIDEEICGQEDKSSAARKSLRDSAQDIINMSYECTNSTLLQKMVGVFDKYRRRMRAEIELKKRVVLDKPDSSRTKEYISGHSKWKLNEKTNRLAKKHQRTFRTNRTSLVKKKSQRSGGTIYSSSESSCAECNDLAISE